MMPFLNIADIGSLTGYEFESRCRRYAFFAPLYGNVGMSRVLTRYKIFVDTTDKSLTPHLIMDGFWESWVSQCMARLIKPGDHCIDVGANLGYYSVLMSALSEGGGATLAVEPNPKVCELLQATAEMNSPGFRVVEAAVSDRRGSMELHIPATHLGDASLLVRKDRGSEACEKVKVGVITLDELVKEAGWKKVDLIKIDAEGAEPLVFEGMKQLLRQHRDLRIVLEFSPFLYADPSAFTEKLWDRFTMYRIGAGAQLTRIGRERLRELVGVSDHLDLLLTRHGDEAPY